MEPTTPGEQETPQLQSEQVVDAPEGAPEPEGASFSWEASEFVHHEKKTGWYVGFAVLLIVLCAGLAYLKQWTTIALAIAMSAAIAVYARKAPRTLVYKVNSTGITFGEKASPYSHFKSYSVQPEVGWKEIDLEPARRLEPRLTLLAGDEEFDQIEAILQQHIPRNDRELDFIERLSKYLKF